MQGEKFMQLLIILALLLYGGGNARNMLSEVKPVLESIGGEEMQKALKSAEEISEVLSTVQSFSGFKGAPPHTEENSNNSFANNSAGFPLAPISAIADKEITYSLNKYINEN